MDQSPVAVKGEIIVIVIDVIGVGPAAPVEAACEVELYVVHALILKNNGIRSSGSHHSGQVFYSCFRTAIIHRNACGIIYAEFHGMIIGCKYLIRQGIIRSRLLVHRYLTARCPVTDKYHIRLDFKLRHVDDGPAGKVIIGRTVNLEVCICGILHGNGEGVLVSGDDGKSESIIIILRVRDFNRV